MAGYGFWLFMMEVLIGDRGTWLLEATGGSVEKMITITIDCCGSDG